ncbi:MAG: endonuclease III domain-containing protein [Planctomycetaceae bacterium]
MSDLTLSLLRQKPSRHVKRWRARMAKITDRLVAEYGTPSLGNFRDPVKEIFYIVLSARTTESLYKRVHKRLWSQFPSLEAIAKAPLARLRNCVETAGLGKKRAAQIKAIASKLLSDFGTRPAIKLRRLSAEEAYAALRSLPGVGPKSALCVMMYSLGFDVFPVDAHAHRILCRIGLIGAGAKHYHAQEVLPGFVPPERSKELHVALVFHGRQICKPRTPLCAKCAIRILCEYGNSHSVAAPCDAR